jgi:hypothetical protein
MVASRGIIAKLVAVLPSVCHLEFLFMQSSTVVVTSFQHREAIASA